MSPVLFQSNQDRRGYVQLAGIQPYCIDFCHTISYHAQVLIHLLLNAGDEIRDDSFVRLGLSLWPRVTEVVSIRTSEIDFERGLIKSRESKYLKRHVSK